jgi:fibronectin-binding autotransporter adhesin
MTRVVNSSAVSASRGSLDRSASPLHFGCLGFGWYALLLAMVTCIALLSARRASAANDTWTGGGLDNNWMTAGNWGGTAPMASDSLIFDGIANTTTNNDFATNTQFSGITFAATAGAFTLGGNAVLLGGDINDNSTTQPEMISLPLLLDGATSNVNVASGGSLALGALTFGLAAGSTNVSTLNVNNTVSATSSATSLSVRTNTTAVNTINIAGGATFNISGGTSTLPVFVVGVAPSGTNTNTVLNVAGAGTLNVTSTANASFNVGVGSGANGIGGNPVATLDMSQLANFVFSTGTGSFGVGNLVTRSSSTVNLANASNSITAATVGVGDSNQVSSGNNFGNGSNLFLGAGTNVINANTINVGNTKSAGSIQFLKSTGSLTIQGEAGGASTVNITVGRGSANTDTTTASQFLLAGNTPNVHTVNIQAGTVQLGVLAGSTGGAPAGVMTFDTGTFTVNSLQLAVDSSGSAPSGVSGTLTLGSDSTSSGMLNVNTALFLGNVTNTSTVAKTDRATFTINGGTANINANIQSVKAAAATGTTLLSELDLQGGTLNMNGNVIGTAAAPITNVHLVTTGTSATLQNLGGAGINGAGLTMNGNGTLLLGPNTYTGDTSLATGVVQLNDANPLANSSINMSGAGVLQFSPNIGTFSVGGLKGNAPIALANTGAAAVILNLGTFGGTYSGALSGPGGLTISGTSGATTQTLTGNSTYIGNTTINSGTLRVKGELLYSDPGTRGSVGVSGGALAGDGQISTDVTMSSGTIAPDVTGTSLHLGSLTTGGGTLQFTLSGSTIGNLLVDNTANLNSGALQFGLSGNPVLKTYTILSAGTLHNSLSLSDQVVGTTNFHPFVSGNMLDVTVSYAGSSLIWVGANNGGAWDITTTKNWNNTTLMTNPDFFHNLDAVTFDNSSTVLSVNITAPVQPGTVTFNNNVSHNYVIGSTNGNGIGDVGGGVTTLTMNGAGTVTLNTANTYGGATNINAGTLVIGATGSVAGSTLTMASGAAATVSAGGSLAPTTANVSGTLTDSGTVGITTLTLTAPAVATVTSTGTLGATNVNVNGGSLTVQPSGTLSSASVAVANGGTLRVQAGGLVSNAPNLTDNGAVTFNSDQTIGSLTGIDPTSTLSETGTLTVGAGGSYAGAIKDDGPGSLTVSAGTLILSGPNTYTGATTINSGATLQIDDGSNAGSLSSTTAIQDDGTLIFARTDTPTVSNTISGAGKVEQNGVGGTLTLTGNNTYTGGTTVLSGTLVQGSANALGDPAGALVLGTPEPATGGVTTPSGNLTLNFNTTVGSFSNTAGTVAGTVTPSVLTINQGLVLTDNGDFTVGFRNATNSNQAINTSLTVTGGGSLVVTGAGNVNIGQASNNAGGKDVTRVDMSGLNSVTVNTTGNFNVGFGANDQGNLTLAGTTVNSVAPVNSINATAINVGNSAFDNDPGVSTLNLGAGANTLNANTITIGSGKTGGTVQFVPGAPTTASVTIAGTGGGTATANIAVGTANSVTFANRNSTLLLAGHPATVQAGTVIVGQEAGNSSGTPNGSITFDTGSFSADSLQLAVDASGTSAAGSVGSFTLGADSTSTGVLSIASFFFLANNTNTTAGTVTGTFTINGGTANVQCNISIPSTQGTSNTTLNINGGTLNMNGFAIGGDGTGGSGPPITNVNLVAAGQSATLANLGGGGINNAGLNMNGSGTLTLTGPNNNYTGGTTVSGGTLRLNTAAGSALMSSAVTVTVTNAGTLELAGPVSSLSDGTAAHSANIVNNSAATAGILVSGTNQRVGRIDGAGTTQVNDGSQLTANHIVQMALVIGVTGSGPSLVTIDASDASGNPLGMSGGFALAESLTPSGPFGADGIRSANLSSIAADSADQVVLAIGKSVGSNNPALVPEPSTLLLALLAVLGVISTQFARHHFRRHAH